MTQLDHTHTQSHEMHHTSHDNSQHHHDGSKPAANINKMAFDATLHCIIGCATGEILGLIIGTAIGLSVGANILLAVVLSFLFGYSFSLYSLHKAGLSFRQALPVVLAADTLSILTMELVDNTVMLIVPGAMGAGLNNLIYWVTMPISLLAAFVVALPVNRYLLTKGKGHAIVHEYHKH